MISRRQAAMALPTSLIIVSLMLILMGAFGKIYNSHFSITRNSNSSRATRLGCESVYDYVVYRLEHDRSWGSNVFATSTPEDAFGGRIIATEMVGTHRIEGEIPELDMTFTADVWSFFGDSADEEVTSRVSKGKALCHVWVTHRQLKRRVEFELSVAPRFDSSVLTRADVYVNSTDLIMRSRDPDRNFIRAEGDITVPNILSDDRSKFLEEHSNELDHDGMLWAKGDVNTFQGGTSESISTAGELATANENSGGRIVANANSDFSIFDLDSEQLRLSEDQRTVNHADLPGRWNFVRVKAKVSYEATYNQATRILPGPNSLGFEEVTYKKIPAREGGQQKVIPQDETVWIDVLEHYPPDNDTPDRIYRGEQRTQDLVPQVLENVSERRVTRDNEFDVYFVREETEPIRTISFEIDGYEEAEFLVQDTVQYGSGGAALRFDLNNQRVTADPAAKVDVDGPFEITSETRYTEADLESSEDVIHAQTPPPVLNLGVNDNGSQRATVIARETIDIREGLVEGLGALISRKGDVNIQPAGQGAVSVDGSNSDNGLVIYAGGDVNLGKPNDGASNWSFKGLVYSRGDVHLEGRGQNVSFEGAVVSLAETEKDKNGIYFDDCGRVEFIYNRDLLGALIERMPGGRIELEPVLWKE